ncbi:MAG: hypothetical protein KDA25_12435 [Phycisphaerales bacterium]|nr:hypothetical protein [Phycisphaerales bacterium]
MIRFIANFVAVLTFVGLVTGVAYAVHEQRREELAIAATRDGLRTIMQHIALRAALEAEVELTPRGYPSTIDPAWFADGLPANELVGAGHPWMEVAREREYAREHPRERTAAFDAAAFWYNPANGIVRARVPIGGSDADALALYNRLNDTNLKNLFE